MKSKTVIGLMLTFVCGVATGTFLLRDIEHPGLMNTAAAQQPSDARATSSPTKAIASRDVYFPGTEDLDPDEMRITALGTGMPSARPKQAAACFLVELGNGTNFCLILAVGLMNALPLRKFPTTI